MSVFREGDVFVAYSPVLDLSTSGESFELAKNRFGEVVQIFFEELIEKGTVEEVLSDMGWEKQRSQWVPPILISQETESFNFKF